MEYVNGQEVEQVYGMYEALVNDGISENRISKEDKSSSTYENLLFSKQILEDSGKPLRIAIAVSYTHLDVYKRQVPSY